MKMKDFFFLKVWAKNVVPMVHRSALYTAKYSTLLLQTEAVMKG